GDGDEDDPGAPCRIRLYVDECAAAAGQPPLAEISRGRAGGPPSRNYTPAIKDVYGVRPAEIAVMHERGRQQLRAGDAVLVEARTPFVSDEIVSCGIPGHDRPGEELVHEILRVDDDPLTFEFHGRCGFA